MHSTTTLPSPNSGEGQGGGASARTELSITLPSPFSGEGQGGGLSGATKLATTLALFTPTLAQAHGFGRLYNLPVPFWLYGWGASAALALSFLLAAYFATAPASTTAQTSRDLSNTAWARALRRAMPALRAFAVFILLLCIATGLFGNRDPQRNFNMTFFWVIFTLLVTYLTAFFGNFYEALNPWRTLTRLMGRHAQGRYRYPEFLGDWPALALYLGFIWFELFGYSKPFSVATALLSYTALNFLGVFLIGSKAWFRHCEFFSVFLRLVALISPIDYRRDDNILQSRPPLSGLVRERPQSMSGIVFVLAMLSTTAFDGLRATQFWVFMFWSDPTGIVTHLAGVKPYNRLADVLPWYEAWESAWLIASPFIYLGVYLAFVALGKLITRNPRPLRQLALDFGYTLIPIALVYGMTHYSTLLLTQGLKIVSLASDPFGWDWNLLGTAHSLRAPILPPMAWVWHTQVGLILLGHVISVYLAHKVALQVFPTRARALASQLPMLLLMMAFTVSGLWILSQPLTMEAMR